MKTGRLTREERQKETRERLLEAACDEVAQHGIQAASIRNISEAAGFSQGAFYSNFESKEHMLFELMKDHVQRESVAFCEIVETTKPGGIEETLESIATWLKALRANRSLSMIRLELQMHANRNPDFAAAYDEIKSAYQADFAKGLALLFKRHGLTPTLAPLQMAIALLALWSGFAVEGTVAKAKPFDETLLVILRAFIDTAESKKKVTSKRTKQLTTMRPLR